MIFTLTGILDIVNPWHCQAVEAGVFPSSPRHLPSTLLLLLLNSTSTLLHFDFFCRTYTGFSISQLVVDFHRISLRKNENWLLIKLTKLVKPGNPGTRSTVPAKCSSLL